MLVVGAEGAAKLRCVDWINVLASLEGPSASLGCKAGRKGWGRAEGEGVQGAGAAAAGSGQAGAGPETWSSCCIPSAGEQEARPHVMSWSGWGSRRHLGFFHLWGPSGVSGRRSCGPARKQTRFKL